MKKRIAIFLAIFLALALIVPVSAQNYSFAVDTATVHVYWNADGTMSLDYTWVFRNQPGASAIDFVDVGMPNNYYGDILAEVNGNPVSISTDYQGDGSYGFAVDLGSQAIRPGQTGTVHVYVGRIERMLYPDSDDETYASAVFVPTWFGSQFVTGDTDYTVTYHLPPGVQPEEPKWHGSPSGFPAEPEAGHDSEGRIIYTWYSPDANISRQYTFGASFPRTYVPAEAIYTPPATPIFNFDLEAIFPFLCFGFFAFIFFGIPVLTAIGASRRKLKYMPPRISIEGHGIKRGLTAVEAAVLMEQPLDKVMTMILFGVVKKGAAEVVKRDPLELGFAKEPPAELHQYEKDFLKAFTEKTAAPRRKLLQEMTVSLVRSVTDKMKGFSRKETMDYYKAIMEKAWVQVEAANTPEVKGQLLEQNLEWTMLDKDYDDRSRRTFTGPIFVPTWWGRYDPTFRPATTSSSPVSGKALTSAGGGVSRPPSLPGSDFAASVVGGVQNFSQKVIGNVSTFTEKVTGVTNPPPKPSSSSYRGGSGGGRSCACACACAGCACACAGGGR